MGRVKERFRVSSPTPFYTDPEASGKGFSTGCLEIAMFTG